MTNKNKNLRIYTLFNKPHKNLFKSLTPKLEKYFNYKNVELKKNELEEIVKSKKIIDILFISKSLESEFKLEYYQSLQKLNSSFSYIVVADEHEDDDIQTFKDLADDIIHIDLFNVNYITWKFISILRRYWNQYSKKSTIIYKDVIADFVDQKIFVNKEEVELTLKEILVLKLFMNNIGKYMTKEEVFKKVWGTSAFNNSRSVDQIIFKLKKKISSEYFQTKRNSGIKFE